MILTFCLALSACGGDSCDVHVDLDGDNVCDECEENIDGEGGESDDDGNPDDDSSTEEPGDGSGGSGEDGPGSALTPTVSFENVTVGYTSIVFNVKVSNYESFNLSNVRLKYSSTGGDSGEKSVTLGADDTVTISELKPDSTVTIKIVCNYSYNGAEFTDKEVYSKDIALKRFSGALSFGEFAGDSGNLTVKYNVSSAFPDGSVIDIELYGEKKLEKAFTFSAADFAESSELCFERIPRGEYTLRAYCRTTNGDEVSRFSVAEKAISLDYDYFNTSVSGLSVIDGSISFDFTLSDRFSLLDNAVLELVDSKGEVVDEARGIKTGVSRISWDKLLPDEEYSIYLRTDYYDRSVLTSRELVGGFESEKFACYPDVEISEIHNSKNEIKVTYTFKENLSKIDRYAIVLDDGVDRIVIKDAEFVEDSNALVAEYRLVKPNTDYTLSFYATYSLYGVGRVNELVMTKTFKSDDHSLLPTLALVDPDNVKDGYVYTDFNTGDAVVEKFHIRLYDDGELIVDKSATSISQYIYLSLLKPGEYRLVVSCDFYGNQTPFMNASEYLLLDRSIKVTEATIPEMQAKFYPDIRIDSNGLTVLYRAYSDTKYQNAYIQLVSKNGEVLYQDGNIVVYNDIDNYNYDAAANGGFEQDFWYEYTLSGIASGCEYVVRIIQYVYYADENAYVVLAERNVSVDSATRVTVNNLEVIGDTVKFDCYVDLIGFDKTYGLAVSSYLDHGIITTSTTINSFDENGYAKGELGDLRENAHQNIVVSYRYNIGGAYVYFSQVVGDVQTIQVSPVFTYKGYGGGGIVSTMIYYELAYDSEVVSFADGLKVTATIYSDGQEYESFTVDPSKTSYMMKKSLIYEQIFGISVTAEYRAYGVYYSKEIYRGDITTIRVDGKLKYTKTFDGYVVTGIDSNYIYYRIPDTYDGEPVIGIADTAFRNNKKIKYLEIGRNVEYIGTRAFYGCSNLVNVYVKSRVLTDIGDYAFASTKLRHIVLPDSVVNVGVGAFSGCISLTNANMNGVGALSEELFSGCVSLSVVEANGATAMNTNTFYGCTALTKVGLRKITVIPEKAFQGCTQLQSFAFSPNLSEIGDYAFSNCSSLGKFYAMKVKKIGNYAFANISYIPDAYFFDELEYIGEGAFENSTVLNVYLPDTLKYIGKNAFASDTRLNTFTYEGTATDYMRIERGGIQVITTISSSTDVRFLRTGSESSLYDLYIGGDVTEIPANAFNGFTLKGIYISDSVESIGEGAFSGVTVKNIYIGSGLKEVAENAFKDVRASAVRYNGDVADWCKIKFANLHSTPMASSASIYFKGKLLSTVSIPDSVESIGNYQFAGFSVQKIIITEKTEQIGRDAFRGAICYEADLSVASGVSSDALYGLTVTGKLMFDGSLTDLLQVSGTAGVGISFTGGVMYLSDIAGNYVKPTYLVIEEGHANIPWEILSKLEGLTRVYLYSDDCYIPSTLPTDAPGIKFNEYENSLYLGCRENPYLSLIKTNATGTLTVHSATETIQALGTVNLNTIYLPKTLKRIENGAFMNNYSNISYVYYDGGVNEWAEIIFESASSNPFYTANYNAYLMCFDEANNKYTSVTSVDIYAERVSAYAFYNLDTLVKVTLHCPVKYVGEMAFYCTGALKMYAHNTDAVSGFAEGWNRYPVYQSHENYTCYKVTIKNYFG